MSATAGSDAALQTLAVDVTRLATATVAQSDQGVGSVIDSAAALASAGFGTTVNTDPSTATTFTITTVDTTSGAQDSQQFSLTDTTTLTDVINNINTQFGGTVTAALTTGTDGRANNRLQLTANAGLQLRLGDSDDTSNFLTSSKLINGVQSGTTVTSIGNLGVLRPTESLGSTTARVDGGALTGTGTFEINGVSIAWDSTSDSLNDVIGRINASDAKVNATYDTINDTLDITAKDTGSAPIAMTDTAGTFLQSFKLTGVGASTQTLGDTATFTINGTSFETQSNQVSEIVPSVTLDLKNTGTANVTVTQDVDGALEAITDFIGSYNEIVQQLEAQTRFDPATKQAGVLLGDLSARFITTSLRSIVSGPMETQSTTSEFTNLASVGISTGRIGSGVVTSTQLQFDEAKFREAIAENPTAVGNLFATFSASAALTAGSPDGALASASGSPTSERREGRYEITSDASGNLSAVFTPTGGQPGSALTGSIGASGTNETLIPGVTLTAAGTLTAGTDFVDITIQERGIFVRINELLRDVTSATGSLVLRQQAGDDEIRRLRDQIDRAEDRLTVKEESLNRKFAAIERALAQLQQQSSSLASSFAALSGTG
ncbi:MAG: flagellar hook protein [Dehalococcoidia bacterium]|nr:flagellar hook protein [Dehalococcoidia bacterium]